jgi:hypothetical protein
MGTNMYRKIVSAMYILNIVAQALITLVTPAALLFFVGWLLVSKAGLPTWTYAIAIVLGILMGLVSMVKFVISASESLERLEKQRQNKHKTGNSNNEE